MPRGKRSSCQRWHIMCGTCLMRKLSKIRSALSNTTQSLIFPISIKKPWHRILLPGSLILIKSFNPILGGCYRDKDIKSYLISWMLLRRGRTANRFFRPLLPKQLLDRLTGRECGVQIMSETRKSPTWVAAKIKETLKWTGGCRKYKQKIIKNNVL